QGLRWPSRERSATRRPCPVVPVFSGNSAAGRTMTIRADAPDFAGGNEMSTNSTSQRRASIRSHLVRYALLLAGGLIAAATPAFAQSFNNLCVTEKIGGNPSCTANDVRIGTMHLIAGPSSCDPTDPTPFAVTLEATIESGPDRYDIGLWLNTDGGSALSDPS